MLNKSQAQKEKLHMFSLHMEAKQLVSKKQSRLVVIEPAKGLEEGGL